MITIRKINLENQLEIFQTATMISEGFKHAYPTLEDGIDVINSITIDGTVCFIALENDQVIGVVGGISQYGTTGWELHPLIVKKEYRNQHIASKLLNVLEDEIRHRGGVMIYLGTDDEFDQTSLSNVNLFDQMHQKIENIQNLNNHPFSFYQKCGYTIVGVMPDANGLGKPDIIMAKRIIPWKDK